MTKTNHEITSIQSFVFLYCFFVNLSEFSCFSHGLLVWNRLTSLHVPYVFLASLLFLIVLNKCLYIAKSSLTNDCRRTTWVQHSPVTRFGVHYIAYHFQFLCLVLTVFWDFYMWNIKTRCTWFNILSCILMCQKVALFALNEDNWKVVSNLEVIVIM